MKKRLLQLLRIALAIAFIAWIYTRTSVADLGKTLSEINVSYLICIAILLIVCMCLQGIKWWVLIRRFVPELKMSKAISVHVESMFYTAILPSGAQDVVKSVMLSKFHSSEVVWAASWLAKLCGFIALLAVSVVGLVYIGSNILPDGFRTAMIIAIVAILSLSALSFSKRLTYPIRKIAVKIVNPEIMERIKKIRDGIYVFRHEYKTLAQTFFISMITHLLIIFNTSLVIYTICGKFYFVECLAFVPLVEVMVVALPLTPGGIGIREGMMALFFTNLGFSASQIAAYATISLLSKIVVFVGGIPPLYRIITGKKS